VNENKFCARFDPTRVYRLSLSIAEYAPVTALTLSMMLSWSFLEQQTDFKFSGPLEDLEIDI